MIWPRLSRPRRPVPKGEALDEGIEELWITFLNRFDTVIYTTLFAPRGYTKGEALIAYRLEQLEERIAATEASE